MAREPGSNPDASPGGELSPDLEPLLADCRRSLERGDYGLVLRTLEPLVGAHPPTTAAGAEMQLLLATAWMGQGNGSRAIACCHQLKRSSNAELRAQARDLLAVLEAPALERPREWSITLPELGDVEAVQGRMRQLAGRRRTSKPPPPPPPPVGPSRANGGFVLLVAVLMVLAILLGGCMQVRAELHFAAPGRLQLGYTLTADGGRPTPWQRQFGDHLQGQGFRLLGARGPEAAAQHWQTAVLPAEAALAQLSLDLGQAARLAGLELPPPVISLRERNLLLGVRQSLSLDLDLTPLAGVGGLELSLDLEPVPLRAVRRAVPLAAQRLPGKRALRWPLRPGERNQVQLQGWRWSPLGLGALAVLATLTLALALQALRRSIVPPLPELPA